MAATDAQPRSLVDIAGEFEAVKKSAVESVQGLFPILGKTKALHLDKVWVDDNRGYEDLRGQLRAKLEEKTWGVPLMGRIKLTDAHGKVIDSKEVRLAELPKPTPRMGYIVNGQEYQLDSQWRLRPGIYSRVKDNGELEAHVNTAGGDRLAVEYDPVKRRFTMAHGGSTMPLFPLLKALGADDGDLRKAWGSEVFDANSRENYERTVRKFHKIETGKEARDLNEATRYVRESLRSKGLDPKVTEVTLGKPVERLDQIALTLTAKKLLAIARGDDDPDDRDALPFKQLHTTEDFIGEKVRVFGNSIRRHLGNVVDRESDLGRIAYPGMLDRAVSSPFTDSVLSRIPSQDNPVEFLEGHTKTSPLGQGGISNLRMISDEMKGVSPTQLGYMDPNDTPEGEKVGISGHLTLGAYKKGNDVYTRVYNMRTGKYEFLAPPEFVNATVALPDYVRWEGPEGKKRPVPVGKMIRAAGPGNEIMEVSPGKVDYVIPSPASLLGPASSLIPFIQNDDAPRVGMADRHLSQAISLKHRELPRVRAVPSEGRNPAIDLPGALASHKAKVSGTVSKVDRGLIMIKTKSGATVEHQIYDYFPLNDKRTGIHSESKVKVGDAVREGDVLADSNFTSDGKLALGVNLRVGYIAIPGKTFEDGVVISETAAKKLISTHLHRHTFEPDENTRTGKTTFAAYYPTRFNRDQLAKLDDDGVIREGETIRPGDPLSVMLQKQVFTTEARAMAKLKRSMVKPYSDASTDWDHEVEGKVVRVHKLPDGRSKIFIHTEEPMQIADKLSGTHGNKGTVVEIRPDSEMPRDAQGKPIEMALNPYGVAGRMNIGQIFELAAGKISEKTGKPYEVTNFSPGVDYGDKIRKELREHGIPEKDPLYDPKTGKLLGDVFVGPAYIIKQRQQVEKKISARSGGPGFAYDVDRQPRRGGQAGAQALGGLGNLALLSHGARSIMREAVTYKSDLAQQDELWRAIQMGMPLPPPKSTFAQKKFEDYLLTLGVKLKKDGTRIQMVPVRDEDILRISSGKIEKPNLLLRAHDLAPEPGGLFDQKVTGGFDGDRMAHIKLPESIPNPFFERGVTALTDLTKTDLLDVLAGKKAIKAGEVVSPKEPGALTGSVAIRHALKSIDVSKEISNLRLRLPALSGQVLDRANKKLRYLEALKESKISPDEAYMTSVVPVMPPTMRPIVPLPSGDLATDPLNETYKALGITVHSYNNLDPGLPERSRGRLRKELYTSLAALQGVGAGYKRVQGGETQGIMDIFIQPTAKHAWVQSHLFKQRQDLSGRSVIVPDPDLQLDEIGVPHRIASEIYKPFVVRELTRTGYAPLKAEQMIKVNDPMAEAALRKVMAERPVLAKRDPVLHKYGIQAFRPRLDKGFAIKIHPLVTGGFNADFDGDTMSLYVPITPEAVADAKKMMPSNNLLHPATGHPVYTPSQEMSLGLYRATKLKDVKAAQEFRTVDDALEAHLKGKVGWEPIKINGKPTTSGRVRVYASLPVEYRKDEILYDPEHVWNSKRTNAFLKQLASEKPQEYAKTVQHLMELGAKNVYEDAFSLGPGDFVADKGTREKVFSWAKSEETKVRSSGLPQREKNRKVLDVWMEASDRLDKEHWAKDPAQYGLVAQMSEAGSKPGKVQYKQLVLSPVMLTGMKGRLISAPQQKSYSEGVDTADFFVHGMAGRAAMVKKTQEVRDPGYLTKQMVNTVADSVVAARDCGTTDGISMSVDHPDTQGRYLAKPVSAGGDKISGHTLLTGKLVDRLRKDGVQSVVVRSPLKCRLPHGICATCYGVGGAGHLHEIGDNVGVLAGQAVGERSTQLFMRAFHYGGVAQKGGGAGAVSQFDRVTQLLRIPQHIPNSATLAESSGEIRSIRPDPIGHRVTLRTEDGRDIEHLVPGALGLRPELRRGAKVTPGMPISNGAVNLHDLLRTSGIEPVQNQIVNELDDIYRREGIKRRNMEILARGVTNLGMVEDAGDNPTVRRGDMIPLSVASAWNDRKLGKAVKTTAVLKGMGFAPLELTEDWLSKLHHERMKDTLVDASLEGHQANISGLNPFSALAFSPAFGKGISGEPGAY